MTRIVVDNVAAPLKLAGPVSRVLPKLSVAAMKMLSRALFSPDGGAPRTRFNQPVSSQRVFESVVFDFATIKRIRAAVPGATVNDAVLAIVGGAMRRYLESKKELPAQSLVALAPVNTRQDAGERQTTGNMISFLTFPLASDIADPLARLAKIQQAHVADQGAVERDRRPRSLRHQQVRAARHACLCRPARDDDGSRRHGAAGACTTVSSRTSRAPTWP